MLSFLQVLRYRNTAIQGAGYEPQPEVRRLENFEMVYFLEDELICNFRGRGEGGGLYLVQQPGTF